MKPAISNEEMKAYFKTKKGKVCNVICRGTAHNSIKSHLRRVFASMVQRCTDPKVPNYHRYGGRGIKVCFKNSNAFVYYVINMLKIDPRGLDIDRIDNGGNYEPGNIHFIAHQENCQNKG